MILYLEQINNGDGEKARKTSGHIKFNGFSEKSKEVKRRSSSESIMNDGTELRQNWT